LQFDSNKIGITSCNPKGGLKFPSKIVSKALTPKDKIKFWVFRFRLSVP